MDNLSLNDLIGYIQDIHCRNCKAGLALMALRDLCRDEESRENPAQNIPKNIPAKKLGPPKRQHGKSKMHDRTLLPDGKKQCTNCGQIKDITEYYPHPMINDGHDSQCKACKRKKRKKERKKMHAGRNSGLLKIKSHWIPIRINVGCAMHCFPMQGD